MKFMPLVTKPLLFMFRVACLLIITALFVSPMANKVNAQPFEGGECYRRSNGVFQTTACPASIQPASAQCVELRELPSGEMRYYNFDCATGNQITEIEPSPMAGESPNSAEAGTLSGEGDPSLQVETDCNVPQGEELDETNCEIVRYLVMGINFMSALAGIAIIGSLIIAGYQYMTAKDNSSQVEASRKRITWAMVALGIFIFMYTILNWLVPGGVL